MVEDTHVCVRFKHPSEKKKKKLFSSHTKNTENGKPLPVDEPSFCDEDHKADEKGEYHSNIHFQISGIFQITQIF